MLCCSRSASNSTICAVVVLCGSLIVAAPSATLHAQTTEGNSAAKTDWTEAERDLKRIWDQEIAVPRDESVVAWKEFLARKDLDEKLRMFAYWRIGCLCSFNYDKSRGEGPRSAEAVEPLEKVFLSKPELMSWEAIHAAGLYASLSGSALEKAQRTAKAYHWLATRTEKMVQRSAEELEGLGHLLGPKFFSAGPSSNPSVSQEERVKAITRHWQQTLHWGCEQGITNQITYTQDPAAIAVLLKGIEDVAPPEMMQKWREMLLNSPDGVGLQQKLDEQAVDIDLVPDLADAQEPHPGGRDEQPPGQSDTDIGEPSDSSAHGAPSRGKWLFPVVAAAALGAVAFIVLRRRKQSSP